MEKLRNLIEGLDDALTLEDLNREVSRLRDHLGVRHAIYHSVSPGGEQYAALTYPRLWVETYIRNGYERIDPVVIGCRGRYEPVDWKDLDWSSKAARALMQEAQRFGVGRQGFSVPIHGPSGKFALFTVTANMEDAAWARYVAARSERLVLAAHYLNRTARRIDGTEGAGGAVLSPRETDALSLLAMGLSRAQAAASLSISEHTLRAYIEGARLKLGASNTLQAVARATSRGLLVV